MKKVLAIAFIAATMVACNNKSDKKTGGEDTAAKAPDTTVVTNPDTAAKTTPDTAAAKMDTTATK